MNTRVTAVVGLQYGNEGKENIASFIAEDADIIIKGVNGRDDISRFRGLPSGVLNPDSMNIYGPGCIIDFRKINDSIQNLRKSEELDLDNIFFDCRAAVWMPYHSSIEDVMDDKLNGLALRCGDILEDDVLRKRISYIVEKKNPTREKKLDTATLLGYARSFRAEFANFILDTTPVVRDSVEDRGMIVIEGDGGLLKDPDYGIAEPEMFHTTLGAIADGSGVGAHSVNKVVGVAKCYTSIIGDDRFPTATDTRISAVLSESEDHRRARTGWIDVTALDYACYINGVDELALTRIDALDRFDKVRLCTGYMIEGEYYSYLPERERAQKAQPIYETMDGWMTDTSGLEKYEDLPENARAFLERIAEATGRKLRYVTTGPDKDDVIKL